MYHLCCVCGLHDQDSDYDISSHGRMNIPSVWLIAKVIANRYDVNAIVGDYNRKPWDIFLKLCIVSHEFTPTSISRKPLSSKLLSHNWHDIIILASNLKCRVNILINSCSFNANDIMYQLVNHSLVQ